MQLIGSMGKGQADDCVDNAHREHLMLLRDLETAINRFNWAEKESFDSANCYLTYVNSRLEEFYRRQRRTDVDTPCK